MKLNELHDNPGARTSRKRLGRGIGSGLGKTSGKGHKGAKARRSNPKPRYFEGGQMPIYRRVPKRGFQNPTRVEYAEVNTGRLQAAIEAGRLDAAKTVDAAAMIAAGLVRRELAGIRLLGKGAISAAVTIEVVGASKGAIAAVEQAGGKVVVLGAPAAEA
jgi:large subunit ribosomal protein L15